MLVAMTSCSSTLVKIIQEVDDLCFSLHNGHTRTFITVFISCAFSWDKLYFFSVFCYLGALIETDSHITGL